MASAVLLADDECHDAVRAHARALVHRHTAPLAWLQRARHLQPALHRLVLERWRRRMVSRKDPDRAMAPGLDLRSRLHARAVPLLASAAPADPDVVWRAAHVCGAAPRAPRLAGRSPIRGSRANRTTCSPRLLDRLSSRVGVGDRRDRLLALAGIGQRLLPRVPADRRAVLDAVVCPRSMVAVGEACGVRRHWRPARRADSSTLHVGSRRRWLQAPDDGGARVQRRRGRTLAGLGPPRHLGSGPAEGFP